MLFDRDSLFTFPGGNTSLRIFPVVCPAIPAGEHLPVVRRRGGSLRVRQDFPERGTFVRHDPFPVRQQAGFEERRALYGPRTLEKDFPDASAVLPDPQTGGGDLLVDARDLPLRLKLQIRFPDRDPQDADLPFPVTAIEFLDPLRQFQQKRKQIVRQFDLPCRAPACRFVEAWRRLVQLLLQFRFHFSILRVPLPMSFIAHLRSHAAPSV